MNLDDDDFSPGEETNQFFFSRLLLRRSSKIWSPEIRLAVDEAAPNAEQTRDTDMSIDMRQGVWGCFVSGHE